MPRQKDLKRLVRTRMKKTGESYTTARSRITSKPTRKRVSKAAAAPSTQAAAENPDYAAIAGMSDDKIKEKTGCSWERWVRTLDKAGAEEMKHGEVARLINETFKVDGWWSQTVTVGYERIKGKRARGQRMDGSYEASKSRTFNVPVTKLFDAWSDARTRRRWLDESGVKVRTATAPKAMRLGWPDGTIVAVWFTAKSDSRSNVALAHTKLTDAGMAKQRKQYWSERFDALAEVLAK